MKSQASRFVVLFFLRINNKKKETFVRNKRRLSCLINFYLRIKTI